MTACTHFGGLSNNPADSLGATSCARVCADRRGQIDRVLIEHQKRSDDILDATSKQDTRS